MTTIDLLVGAHRMARQFLHNMCADLTAEEFHHQALPGTNSAAWIVGHLALTARRVAERFGGTGLPEVPPEFVERYKTTRKAADDQASLGNKEELLALYDACSDKLMEAIRHVPVENLATVPTTPVPAVVTNIGELLEFLAMHVMLHCGQISTIRRSLGKPPNA
jgi:uncharacterized damage-inducible protein DinB